MADILIKGMEMPKGGYRTVEIAFDADGHPMALADGGDVFDVIPVPPHGRLIDVAALVDWLKLSYGTSIPIVRGLLFSSIIKEIQEYQSVIPAEEGKQS